MARAFDDASTQYLSVSLSLSEPFTIACWAWLDDSGHHTFVSLGQSAGTYYHALMFYASDLGAFTLGAGGGGGAITTAAPGTGSWFHTVGVWADTDDRRAYLSGGNKGTEAVTRTCANPDRLRIGVTADSTPFAYHDGRLAEVAIWNVALTDAEVAVLATGVSPLLVRPQSLVMYLPLIRDDDEDIVGGLSFTANGGPTVAAHPRVFYPGVNVLGVPVAAAAGVAPQMMHYARLRRA